MMGQEQGALTGQTLGGYMLEGRLGAGGMADVYSGRDLALDRHVAVKILPPSLANDKGYVARFREEARRVAMLNHPNIVPLYQFGEERGLLFLVMPMLRESLRDRMEREGALTPAEATRIADEIAQALIAAHAQGIVHRDVKPENILLDDENKALLTDFGISRDLAFLKRTGPARTLAESGLPVGTPEYMAPEQLRAGDIDQRVDVYALGAVLYETLTGHAPFEASTPYEVASLALTAPLTPPMERNPAISPALNRVIVKALARDPQQRFANSHEMALALEQARQAGMEPVGAAALVGGAVGGAHAPDTSGSQLILPLETPAPLLYGENSLPLDSQPWPALTTPAPKVASRGKRTRRLVSVLVALALLFVCGGAGFTLINGRMQQDGAAPIGQVGLNDNGTPIIDVTPQNAATATAIGHALQTQAAATPGASATQTAHAAGAPNATNSPATTASPNSTPGATATATVGTPTATPTVAPSATATTAAALLTVPTSMTVSTIRDHVCAGQMVITNQSPQTIGWKWASNPFGGDGQYKINNTSTPAPPSDLSPGVAPGGSDTLTVTVNHCDNKSPSYPVTVDDTLGNTYQLTIYVQYGQGG